MDQCYITCPSLRHQLLGNNTDPPSHPNQHFIPNKPLESPTATVAESTTVKILKIGTPEIITIIVLQLEQLDFTVQYCVQKMQTE